MTHATFQHISLLDFVVWCAASDPGFVVNEIKPDVWEARCGEMRYRASSAKRALERLAEAHGCILHDDHRDIMALCEELAPALYGA